MHGNKQPSGAVKVSIGMPVYNDERYLRAAIDSLLAQTFADFELIISDNGSTDGTRELSLAYSEKDRRINYIRQPENIGAAANFRFVLNEARGDFFLWAASDNVHHESFLEILLALFAEDDNAVSAFSPYTDIDEEGRGLCTRIEQDYAAATSLRRLWKFWGDSRANRDVWIYGLHRRQALLKARVPTWWWLNRKIPMDAAYPPLSYLLASGGYLYFKEQPLFIRRVHLNSPPRHSADYAGKMCQNFLLMCLRKLNLVVVSLRDIQKGAGSLVTTSLIAPVIAYECTRSVAEYIVVGLRHKVLKQKQGYVS